MREPSTLIFLCLLCQFAAAAEPAKSERPISGADTVLAIYTQNYSAPLDGPVENQLVFAAWDDGHIVWSENFVQGGSPYRAGMIGPKKLDAVLAKLANDGLLADKSLAQPRFGPDANTTVILAQSKGKRLKMQSWHELYESNGKVVATEHGLSSLDGKTRAEALREASADYLFYRLTWNEVRLAAASLTPTESKPVTGKIEFPKR